MLDQESNNNSIPQAYMIRSLEHEKDIKDCFVFLRFHCAVLAEQMSNKSLLNLQF